MRRSPSPHSSKARGERRRGRTEVFGQLASGSIVSVENLEQGPDYRVLPPTKRLRGKKHQNIVVLNTCKPLLCVRTCPTNSHCRRRCWFAGRTTEITQDSLNELTVCASARDWPTIVHILEECGRVVNTATLQLEAEGHSCIREHRMLYFISEREDNLSFEDLLTPPATLQRFWIEPNYAGMQVEQGRETNIVQLRFADGWVGYDSRPLSDAMITQYRHYFTLFVDLMKKLPVIGSIPGCGLNDCTLSLKGREGASS